MSAEQELLWAAKVVDAYHNRDYVKLAKLRQGGFRRFTSSDWEGFAGATPFADGSDPFILDDGLTVEGELALAIVDGNGMQIIVANENGDTYMVKDGPSAGVALQLDNGKLDWSLVDLLRVSWLL